MNYHFFVLGSIQELPIAFFGCIVSSFQVMLLSHICSAKEK